VRGRTAAITPVASGIISSNLVRNRTTEHGTDAGRWPVPVRTGLGATREQMQCLYILFMECATLKISEIIIIFEGASQI